MSALKLRDGDQPLPIINDRPDIQTMVVADIADRRQVGISRYGTALQPHNGRDALRDLYEELLDGVMYVKQVMVERDNPIDGVEFVRLQGEIQRRDDLIAELRKIVTLRTRQLDRLTDEREKSK